MDVGNGNVRNSGKFFRQAMLDYWLFSHLLPRQETPDPISISPCARVEFKFVRVWSMPRNLGASEPRRQQFLLLRLGDIEWESGPNRAGAPGDAMWCPCFGDDPKTETKMMQAQMKNGLMMVPNGSKSVEFWVACCWYCIWLVVWNLIFMFPFSWEFNHPNLTFTPSFFRGVGRYTTNQVCSYIPSLITIYNHYDWYYNHFFLYNPNQLIIRLWLTSINHQPDATMARIDSLRSRSFQTSKAICVFRRKKWYLAGGLKNPAW